MATSYRYEGTKAEGDNTARLILEGSVEDPKRFVDVGGTIELEDDEVEALRARHSFRKVSDEQAEKQEGGESAPVKGEDQAGTSQNPSGLPAQEKKSGATGTAKS